MLKWFQKRLTLGLRAIGTDGVVPKHDIGVPIALLSMQTIALFVLCVVKDVYRSAERP